MQAYSLDFRRKIVSTYENGLETIQEVAERFSVSASFIKKMLAQKRSTGDVKPIGHRGGQKKRLADKDRKWLLKTVLAKPDITLLDLQERLEKEKKISVSLATLSRELRRLNLRRKKNQWQLVKETRESVLGIGGE
ncbi:MAG: IS630 transposase-related protein [Acidobacteriota bacterium]|nr:IS630 transposase-related protein [Acidobacteriota bacterium]